MWRIRRCHALLKAEPCNNRAAANPSKRYVRTSWLRAKLRKHLRHCDQAFKVGSRAADNDAMERKPGKARMIARHRFILQIGRYHFGTIDDDARLCAVTLF